MKITINPPKKLSGRCLLPSSKSISNRALIVSALGCEGHKFMSGAAHGLENLSDCDDTNVMWKALSLLPDNIDIMAAGTAMRFLTAYLCVCEGERVITGTERMRNRPIGILVEALRQLGLQVEYVEKEGFPPLRIRGGACSKGGSVTLSGDVSSQYISALLMIGPVLQEGLTLKLTGQIVSRPYIEMTLNIMRRFGARAQWVSADSIGVEPTGYKAVPYYVESDWSAASYWYEMVALSADGDACMELPGLFSESLQGDAAVRDMFSALGVETEFCVFGNGLEGVRLRKRGTAVEKMVLDFTHQPDLAQTVVATCCGMGVPFDFCGLQSLKIKETDRIFALRRELGKLGFDIEEGEGGRLRWDGVRGSSLPGAVLDTYEDHRMAMCMAPLALRLGSLEMNDPKVVSKSYPSYWTHLENIGFNIKEEKV